MTSRQRSAWRAGWFYLAFLAIGLFTFLYVPSKVIASGDPVLTTQVIRSNEPLLRFGTWAGLMGQVVFLFLAMELYRVFEQVDANYARLMVAFVLVAIPIAFAAILAQAACLAVLNDSRILRAFGDEEQRALALFFYDSYELGIRAVGLFWGLWLWPLGRLVVKSGFMPKALGVLLIVGCFAYLIDASVALLVPAQHKVVSNIVSLPMAIGELAMIFWLLTQRVPDPPLEPRS